MSFVIRDLISESRFSKTEFAKANINNARCFFFTDPQVAYKTKRLHPAVNGTTV
jgi:hypothetical protein